MYNLNETTIRIATITINVLIILLELYVFKSIKRKKIFLNTTHFIKIYYYF